MGKDNNKVIGRNLMTLRNRITNCKEPSLKKEPLSLPLLMRLAESNGDPKRTIAALRLINQYLMRELKKKQDK